MSYRTYNCTEKSLGTTYCTEAIETSLDYEIPEGHDGDEYSICEFLDVQGFESYRKCRRCSTAIKMTGIETKVKCVKCGSRRNVEALSNLYEASVSFQDEYKKDHEVSIGDVPIRKILKNTPDYDNKNEDSEKIEDAILDARSMKVIVQNREIIDFSFVKDVPD